MRQRGRSVRRRLAIGTVLLGVAAAPAVRAQATLESVTLVWNAPASCPAGEQVLAEVADLVPGKRKDRPPVAAHVDVVNLSAGRWQGVLSMETREVHGERTFEAESCASVASAAALIIAIAIEEGPVRAPTATGPVAPPAPRTARVAARPATVTRKAAPRSEPDADDEPPEYASQLIVAVAGVGEAGAMPDGPAAGGELAAGWALGTSAWRLRLTAGGAYFPTHTVNTPIDGQPAQFSFSLITVSLRACLAFRRDPLELGPCLGGEIDRMSATAAFTPQIQAGSASGVWGAGLGGAFASWAISPLIAVVARGEATLTPIRESFVLQPGPVVVHTPSRVGARGAVGLELRFF